MTKGYLRYRRTMLCAALAACAVFPAVMRMMEVDRGVVLYTVGVYAFIILAFVGFDLVRYAQKVRQLRIIQQNLSYTQHEYPRNQNNIEQLYCGIIDDLYRMMEQKSSDLAAMHAEQTDYYTLWLHQIKTPIAALRLAIESDREPDPVYAEELFKIERYVEMALQYARMGSLSGDLVLEKVALDGVVTSAVKKYSTLFIGKGLGVDFRRTGRVVVTDSKWLAFIIEQLLSNAVKYTAKGGVKIYAEGKTLVIRDSGIGIRSEDLARVFERGYTGRNGRIDERASGLGLEMAMRVAKRLGVGLSLQSRKGEGTRAIIAFPDEMLTPE